MWTKYNIPISVVAVLYFVFVGGTISAVADILHVPSDYPTIQAGMDAAQTGDTVIVADGIYTGPGNKNLLSYMPYTLRSENGPENCIIDLEGSGNAFFLIADESPDFIIDGFTIRNGRSAGGAFFIHHGCDATIRNCIITQCSSIAGGAFLCEDWSSPTIINCLITNNSSISGGGLHIRGSSSPTLINCTIINNVADTDGGGVYIFGFNTNPTFINCTISDNLSNGSGGGLFVFNGNTIIANSVVWGNAGDQIADNSDALIVSYSDIEGGWPGNGNIDADPLLVDPVNSDYHLSPNSPCIDAADNNAVPIGIETDFDGYDRFVDIPCVDDTGKGKPPIVDMGAYEFQLFQVTCPWDLDCNSSVGTVDLLALFANWGPCPPKIFCSADFDGNGTVNTNDLLILFANWGPCP